MSDLLGLLFALIIGSSLNATYIRNNQQDFNEKLLAATTAQQQIEFNNAVSSYVRTYKTQLQEIVTDQEPSVINVSVLKNVNLLPISFGEKNPFNQTWEAQVLQPASGNFQVLTFGAGGEMMKDRQAAKVATIIGKVGGIIPQNDSSAYPLGSAIALGSFGGWQLPTTGYRGITGGRSASLLHFNDGQLMSNYLYRNAVPGQPQLNQMNTALEMNGNNISNAGTVSTATLETTGQATIGGDITATGLVKSAKLQLMDIVHENTPCSSDGLLARNKSGLPLYCQSGVWKQIGGSKTLVSAGGWGGDCGHIHIPPGSSVATHHIVFHWTHKSFRNWEKSHFEHSAGWIHDDWGARVCGPNHDNSAIGGTYIVVATPK